MMNVGIFYDLLPDISINNNIFLFFVVKDVRGCDTYLNFKLANYDKFEVRSNF